MKKLHKNSVNDWLLGAMGKAVLWKKIVLYIVASILIIGTILGVFLLLLFIAMMFREYIPLTLVPWIYGIVYGISTILVFFLTRMVFEFIKPALTTFLRGNEKSKQD